MKCSYCNREMLEPAGYVAGLPVGPVCLKRLVPTEAHPVGLRRVTRIDQPELWDQCYFTQAGEDAAVALAEKHR